MRTFGALLAFSALAFSGLSCFGEARFGSLGNQAERPLGGSSLCGDRGQACCEEGDSCVGSSKCDDGKCAPLLECIPVEMMASLACGQQGVAETCCDSKYTCNPATTQCQPTANCQVFGQTCVNTPECCHGFECVRNVCRPDPSRCAKEAQPCSTVEDCCVGETAFIGCVNSFCTTCKRGNDKPTANVPCCHGLGPDGVHCAQAPCAAASEACEKDSDCCANLKCLADGFGSKLCRRVAEPGKGCNPPHVVCPPETPECDIDDRSGGGIGTCVATSDAGFSGSDGGGLDAGASARTCSADWQCRQEDGDACCLNPSQQDDWCTESQKGQCYRAFVCSSTECTGSANPLVCASCAKTCVNDGVCDPTWENESCADCQTPCRPCERNGVKLQCGIDSVCGTGALCGTCFNSSCDASTQMCTADSWNACNQLCSQIRNCGTVPVQSNGISCSCSPNYSCVSDTCSPNGLQCERTTVVLGGSFSSEPCTWCGGPNISVSQCIACGGYVQGAICAGNVTPDCPPAK